jgi:hypothetical protein
MLLLCIDTIHKINVTKEFHKYTILRNKYRVPNIGYHIKLWDFDFACIPGIIENSKVEAEWTDKINIKPEQNRYYDVHYFFNTLTKKGFFSDFWDAKEIHHSVKQFVRDIVPLEYSTPVTTKKSKKEDKNKKAYVTERGRLLLDIEYTTPEKILLEHEFFDKMRPDCNKIKKK